MQNQEKLVETPQKRKSILIRWTFRIAGCLFVLSLTFVAILPWILITPEHLVGDNLLILSGDRRFEVAEEWAKNHSEGKILFVTPQMSRLQQIGIDPLDQDVFKDQLQTRNIPKERILILPAKYKNDEEFRATIQQWLAADNARNLNICCAEFSSGRLKSILSQNPDIEPRIGYLPLQDLRYTSSNWWRSKTGIRDVGISTLDWFTTTFQPDWTYESPEKIEDFDRYVEQYNDTLNVENKSNGIAHWLNQADQLSNVDCVAVLPGDEQVRPFIAAAIVKAGFAKRVLLITNGVTADETDGLRTPTHERSYKVMKHQGLSDNQIVVLKQGSGSTFGDAMAISTYLDAHPVEKIAVVTSFYHLRRTRMAMNAAIPKNMKQLIYISAPVDGISPENWSLYRKGHMTVLAEYLKLFTYWIVVDQGKYWLGVFILFGVYLASRSFRQKNTKQMTTKAAPT